MFQLALSSLRWRKGSAVGGFLALLSAAMIMCACGVLLETGIRGVIPAERYSGTPVVVSGDQQIHWTDVHKGKAKTKSKPLSERAWLPASVGGRLAALPGARVVDDLTFPADIVRRDGSVLAGLPGAPSSGHGWRSAALTPYALVSGTPPRHDDEVVLDTGLAGQAGLTVGSQVVIQSTSAPQAYRVVGIARPDAPVHDESAVFFDEATARQLAGHDGTVAAYGVFGATADQVKAAVAGTGALVSVGDGRGQAEFPGAVSARTKLTSMGAAIGGTALIVAVLVVAGTFALSIQQRYRELALLRAVGAKPRQVRRMIGREALLLGLAAGIPGALVGIPLGSAIHAALVSLGVVPGTLRLARSPFPVIAAVLVTVCAGWLATRVTARRIARIQPAEALAEAATEPRTVSFGRLLGGVACTALATVTTVALSALHTEPAALPVTYLCVLLWMITAALLGPVLARGAVALLGWPLQASPVGGFFAAQNARANSRRMASVVTPLALLIGMTAVILFVPATLGGATRAQTSAGVRADYVIGSSGPGVPAAAVQALRAAPGASAVVADLQTTIWVGEDKRSAQALTPAGLSQVMDPGVRSGSLGQLAPGTIAMSEAAAQGRHIGDAVQVTLGDGTKAQLRLIAVYSRGLGFGDTLLDFGDVAGHVDDTLAKAVLVTGTVPLDQLRTRIKSFPGLTVTGRSGFGALQAAQQQTGTEVNLVFMGLIIVFTAIAVINTLAMSTHGRSRELALLRLAGTTRRQAQRILLSELALIVAVATALGTGAAWMALTGFSGGMTGSGMPVIVPGTYALIVAGAISLGLVATAIPARLVLRRNPAEEISARR
ncbi:MAG TPA: FtsX-like permease family protein [Trebonia sp.]|nr:FtsX-like permease family protein [Trebonia sp.]